MMMKKYTLSILAIVILASACREEALEPEQQKGEIVLSAFTSYTQDELSTKGPGEEFFEVATKTFFSGKDENDNNVTTNSRKERIDWQEGDKIYVNMLYGSTPAGTAVYTVGGYRTASDKSVSETTSLISGNGLTAQGNGEHTFLSTYPAGGGDSPIGPIDNNGNFTLSMPEGNLGFMPPEVIDGNKYVVRDNMDYAFMVGRTKSSDLSNVKMRLQPYFNAYQFIIGEAPENYRLTKVKLTSSNYLRTKAGKTLTGGVDASGVRVDLSGANDSNCSKEIICDLTQVPECSNGILLAHTDGRIDLTLLALPLEQGNLSVEFTFKRTNNNQTFTKTLNMSGKTLKPYHKLRVENIGSTNWVYVLEVEPTVNFAQADGSEKQANYTVKKSYRYKEGLESATAEAVEWATEINTGGRDAGTEKWERIASYTATADNKPGWITFAEKTNGINGNKGQNAVNRTISAPGFVQHVTSTNPDQFFKDAISMNVHPGNKNGKNNLLRQEDAIDLSMYNLQGGELSGRTTANCYVVSAPGWYKFPLVYGNTLKNGDPNMSGVQGYHLRHDGNAIESPWIRYQLGGTLDDYSAELVWQDNNPSCTFERCDHDDHKHGVIDTLKLQMDNGAAYMFFKVPQHSIQPGNNLIALKKGNDIVWSWHIWVTDQPLEATGDHDRYLSTLIGWIPISLQGGNNGMDVYPARSEQLKIVQVSGNQKIPEGKEAIIFVSQPGNMIQKLKTDRIYKYGRGVYFQYGRKDPMFPAQSTREDNSPGNVTQRIYDREGNLIEGEMAGMMPKENGSNNPSVANSIKEPAVFYSSNNTPFSQHVGGYWSPDKKTVYDPSPIGYRVIDRFTGDFYDSYRSNDYSVHIYNGVSYPGIYIGSEGNLFLPAIGQRSGGDSILLAIPADRDDFFGGGANVAVYSNFWAACGEMLRINVSTWGSGKGFVGNWSTKGTATDGFPILCIVDTP